MTANIQIYNSLSRKKENFKPNNPERVTMYTCGPTVYDYLHIGNLRTSTLMDIIQRSLKFLGYGVYSVMNITDVEDKIEKRAAEQGVTVDEITSKFEKIYYEYLDFLNIHADVFPHASENIDEQIAIIKKLEETGYTYLTDYGVYFDITKDSDYGKLGDTFKSDKAQSRIELTEQKKNPEDFVLWRLPQEGEVRQKLWESPWGSGYPGWHIECSAMSMKCLSDAFKGDGKFHPEKFETIDIHLGGSDLKDVHHENEVAQTESATGTEFVKYWVHGAMLNMGDEKMSKSLGNFVTLSTLLDKGYEPLVLRFFYFSAHYRKELRFSYEALDSTQTALYRLRSKVQSFGDLDIDGHEVSSNKYMQAAREALADDFNMPQFVSILWQILDDQELSDKDKKALVVNFDEVLGLDLLTGKIENAEGGSIDMNDLPEGIKALVAEREEARSDKNWKRADEIRDELHKNGFEIKDSKDGVEVSRVVE